MGARGRTGVVPAAGASPLRAATWQTLIGLLAVTGMRRRRRPTADGDVRPLTERT